MTTQAKRPHGNDSATHGKLAAKRPHVGNNARDDGRLHAKRPADFPAKPERAQITQAAVDAAYERGVQDGKAVTD